MPQSLLYLTLTSIAGTKITSRLIRRRFISWYLGWRFHNDLSTPPEASSSIFKDSPVLFDLPENATLLKQLQRRLATVEVDTA